MSMAQPLQSTDGATCQTFHTEIGLSRQTFVGGLISRNHEVNCIPISRDLTSFGYFLLDASKENCYADTPFEGQRLQ